MGLSPSLCLDGGNLVPACTPALKVWDVPGEAVPALLWAIGHNHGGPGAQVGHGSSRWTHGCSSTAKAQQLFSSCYSEYASDKLEFIAYNPFPLSCKNWGEMEAKNNAQTLYWKKIFNELLKFHCSFPFSVGDPAATETLELSVLPSEMSQRRGLAASQYSCRYHCVFCRPWKYFCALEAAWDPSALHTHQCLLASYLTGWLQENDKEHIIPVMRWWNKSLRLPKWLVILVVSIFGCCILFFRKCRAWRSVPLPALAPFCLFTVDCSWWDKKWSNQN